MKFVQNVIRMSASHSHYVNMSTGQYVRMQLFNLVIKMKVVPNVIMMSDSQKITVRKCLPTAKEQAHVFFRSGWQKGLRREDIFDTHNYNCLFCSSCHLYLHLFIICLARRCPPWTNQRSQSIPLTQLTQTQLFPSLLPLLNSLV